MIKTQMLAQNQTRKYLIIAAILQIVWGIVPSCSKIVIDVIPVELYIAIRWSISGSIFAFYLFCIKGWSKLFVKDIVLVSLLGIIGYGVASLGTLYGLKIGGVTNSALMGSLGPIITSLASIMILSERPQRSFYIALPIAVVGLLLLIIGKNQISSLAIAGTSAAIILGAYALEALVFVFSKHFKTKMSTVQYLAIAQISTAILMWSLQYFNFHQTNQIFNLTFKSIMAIFFVSLVACVLCYLVLYWLLNYVDGHRLALFDGLHTVSATLLGYIFFQESLHPLMIIGGIFILVGLVIGNLSQPIIKDVLE